MSIIRREKSRIGLYHALQQGADNNDLFLDEEDYQVFVDYLKKLMKEAWLENDTPELDYFLMVRYTAVVSIVNPSTMMNVSTSSCVISIRNRSVWDWSPI